MNKIIGIFITVFSITLISCNNEPAETKKEVIVVPAPVEKKEEPKPTSVSIDKNGVQVETKKINVKVKPQ